MVTELVRYDELRGWLEKFEEQGYKIVSILPHKFRSDGYRECSYLEQVVIIAEKGE